MKKLLLTSMILSTSISAFAQDQISVNINGRNYICSGGGSSAQEPTLVRVYCECSDVGGVYLKRIGIMSDGSTKSVSSQALSPMSGSYYPAELMKKCQEMLRDCRS